MYPNEYFIWILSFPSSIECCGLCNILESKDGYGICLQYVVVIRAYVHDCTVFLNGKGRGGSSGMKTWSFLEVIITHDRQLPLPVVIAWVIDWLIGNAITSVKVSELRTFLKKLGKFGDEKWSFLEVIDWLVTQSRVSGKRTWLKKLEKFGDEKWSFLEDRHLKWSMLL